MSQSDAGPILAGRVAVVTGGASGIGRAIAVLLAENGARVFAGDYDPVAENAAANQKLNIVERRCHVRVGSDVRDMLDAAVAAGGAVDLCVNNAGHGMV